MYINKYTVLHPENQQWNITIFSGKYIFKSWIFDCHVSVYLIQLPSQLSVIHSTCQNRYGQCFKYVQIL